MKKCPFCAEEIQDEAIKCRHCGEFLDGAGPPPFPVNKLPWYFRTSVIVIAVLSIGPFALPLVWWHPKMSTAWKVGITLATLALTWGAYQTTVAAYRMLDENMKMLKGSGMF